MSRSHYNYPLPEVRVTATGFRADRLTIDFRDQRWQADLSELGDNGGNIIRTVTVSRDALVLMDQFLAAASGLAGSGFEQKFLSGLILLLSELPAGGSLVEE